MYNRKLGTSQGGVSFAAFKTELFLQSGDPATVTSLKEGYRKEQTFGGRKGFVLEEIPVSKGSCCAFCIQNCFRSAAA